MIRRWFAFAFAIGCATTGQAGHVSPDRAEITGDQALAHVKYLASDELEGRGVKTEGIKKAAAYIADQFTRDGLEPLGDNHTYFQAFDLPTGGKVKGGEFTAGETAWKYGSDFIVLGWSAQTNDLRAPIVFAGFGVTDDDKKWDDYAKLDAKGKIVVVLRKLPKDKGLADHLADVRGKIENAKKHGAVGFILVNKPGDDDEFMRVRGAGDDRGLVALQAKRPVIEKIFGKKMEELESDGPGRAGGEAVAKTMIDREAVRVMNVVGLLRGSDPELSKEYVVVGSHYDHLGKGFPQAWNPFSCKNAHEGLIFHGADDNASGTAGMMEIAEAFAGTQPRPKRSMIFIAFVAEEIGLVGSHHFAENPTVPMENIVAMVNLDMIGRLRDKEGVSAEGATTAPQWEKLLEDANKEHLSLRPSKSLMEDSDHASFYRKDKPVIFFFTGLHEQYHCYTDTSDLINANGLAAVARLAYRTAREVADAPEAHAGLSFTKAQIAMRGASGASGGASGPRLGIAPDYQSEGGLGVAGIIDGTPAAKAGLKVGDLITMLGGKEIGNIEDYMAALKGHKFGDTIEIVVKRGGQSLKLTATLVAPEKHEGGDPHEHP